MCKNVKIWRVQNEYGYGPYNGLGSIDQFIYAEGRRNKFKGVHHLGKMKSWKQPFKQLHHLFFQGSNRGFVASDNIMTGLQVMKYARL